ncbi:MAG: hypothetical protein QM783_08695 [Phycisphaerales bacterium]
MPPFIDFRQGLTTLLGYWYLLIVLSAPTFLRGYDLLLPVYDGSPRTDAYKDEINAHLAAQQPAGKPNRQTDLIRTLDTFANITAADLDKLKGAPPADWPEGKDWPLDLGMALTEANEPVLNRERSAYASRMLDAHAFDGIDSFDPTDAYFAKYDGGKPYISSLLPFLALERRAARLSTVAADLSAAKGDWDGAARHIERILRLADIEARRSNLIAHLVGVAMRQLACNTVLHLVRERQPDAAACKVLAAVLEHHADIGSPVPALQLERLSSLNATAACFTPSGRFSASAFDRVVFGGKPGQSDAAKINGTESPVKKGMHLSMALSLRFGASQQESIRLLNREFDRLEVATTAANDRESVRT